MNNKIFEVYFDCGSSKIRAGAFSKNDPKKSFHHESQFFSDHSNIDIEIQKIISSLEENTNEYLDDISLMIDSSKMLSIGISISKKLDGAKLRKENIQFLIQDAKQQLLRNYLNQNIVHIIIKNYKINDIAYTFLPENIDCNLISIDILFICIPKDEIEYFKKLFFKSKISINQIFCTSYVKSINYKENFSLINNLSFIDIGFNKTSIICFIKNEISFLDVIPIGGNHITKDIANVLKVNTNEAENLKLSFDTNQEILDQKKISLYLIQQIIFARIEEILELSIKSIKLNLPMLNQHQIILMGEGSKILNNKFKEKITLLNDIDLLEEKVEDICQSAFKQAARLNKQEVVIIPKKQAKKRFFEKLFHIFH